MAWKNADLICAAPDMIEALKPFARFCERFDGQAKGLARDNGDEIYVFHGTGGPARITLGDVRSALVALNKATGK